MIYHVPDVQNKDQLMERLDGLGLSHSGLKESSKVVSANKGPDEGRPGIFAAHTDAKQRVGYYPDEQTWHKCGEFWIGVNGSGVKPEQLEKRETIEGHLVKLADGNEWHVPCARFFPQILRLNEEGDLVSEPEAKFKDFSQRCQKLFEIFTGMTEAEDADDPYGMDTKDWWSFAIEALAFNYRLGPWEASALGLLRDVDVMPTPEFMAEKWRPSVIDAVFDLPGIRAMSAEKKSQLQDDSDTDSGDEE